MKFVATVEYGDMETSKANHPAQRTHLRTFLETASCGPLAFRRRRGRLGGTAPVAAAYYRKTDLELKVDGTPELTRGAGIAREMTQLLCCIAGDGHS